MDDRDYIRQLEDRVAILRQNLNVAMDETERYRKLYDGIAPRLEALEMINLKTMVRGVKIGRRLTLETTLNEDLILQCKDNEGMVIEVMKNLDRHLESEMNRVLMAGELKGDRVPMMGKVTWSLEPR